MSKCESALMVLTTTESKQLIAKALLKLDQVEQALAEGYLLLAGGTTNGYLAQELTGREIDPLQYTVGRVAEGNLGVTDPESRIKPLVFKDGQPIEADFSQVLPLLGPDDVFIKGANAIDLAGHAGILVSSPDGGTIGRAWGTLAAKGVNLILPVGLEKLIPSVEAAARVCGQGRFNYATGSSCGLVPITNGLVFTELEALELLFGVEAIQVAAGGQGSCQGAVVVAIHGAGENVEAAFNFVERELKG